MNQNRLRIVHCEHLFNDCEEIKSYVNSFDTQKEIPALYAEPMVFKYGEESNPNIVLAIGSVGDGSFNYDANGVTNKVFFIDFAKAESDIADLFTEVGENKEAIEILQELVKEVIISCGLSEDGKYVPDSTDAIIGNATSLFEADKMLSAKIASIEDKTQFAVEETPSLKLDVISSNAGSTLKGDVKLGSMIYKGIEYANNIVTIDDSIRGDNGLFSNVDIEWDENKSILTLVVNGGNEAVNGFKKEMVLPTDYHVMKGEYDTASESIILTLNKKVMIDDVLQDKIVIPMGDMINEWQVANNSPIVLTKTRVKEGKDAHSDSREYWDVLSADVKISESKNIHNILRKTEDGSELYVDGIASEIKYTKPTDSKVDNVEKALNDLYAFAAISDNNDNIVTKKKDGIYAYVNLEYDNRENSLTLKTTNAQGEIISQPTIKLNSIQLVQQAYYRSSTEEIVIEYTDVSGKLQQVIIPLADVFQDFTVDNTNNNVKLTLTRNSSGPDVLKANVAISTVGDNILENLGDSLYVKGTASNIIYNSTLSVQGILDLLTANDDTPGSIRYLINNEAKSRKTADEQLKQNIIEEKTAREADYEHIQGEINNLTATTTDIQTELDKTQEGAGLEEDGSYKANISSVYIHDAQSLKDADNLLDAAINENASKIAEVAQKVDGDTKDLENKIEALDAKVDDAVSTLESADTAILSELDKTQEGAGLEEDGSYVQNENAEYIDKAKSLADADNKLDAAIKANADAVDATNSEVETVKTIVNNLKQELDKTQEGAGLEEDGSYKANTTSTYIKTADSLKNADTLLDEAIKENADAISELDSKVDDAISDLTVTVAETDSLFLQKTGNVVNGYVKVDTSVNGNILCKGNTTAQGQGLYALVDLTYDETTNVLTFTRSNSTSTEGYKNVINLANASVIDNIYYDSIRKELVIVFHTTSGEPKETRVEIGDLFNEWETANVDSSGNKTNITLTRIKSTEIGGKDTLYGNVNIIDSELHADNILVSENGYLYVPSQPIYDAIDEAKGSTDAAIETINNEITALKATDEELASNIENNAQAIESLETRVTNIESDDAKTKSEVNSIERGAGLDEDGSYIVNATTPYINAAASLNSADKILATTLKEVSDKVDAITGGSEGIQEELDKTQLGAGLEDDGSYKTDISANYINIAQSLKDADRILDVMVKTNADAIKTVSDDLTSTAEDLNNKIASVNETIETLENADAALQSELDKTQVGAGLEEDGSYKANTASTYIHFATSLADADNKLDAAIKTNADAVAELKTDIDALENASTALQSELDKTQVGAGLEEDGSYIKNEDANYIDKAKSLADADNKLDAAVKTNADAVAELKTDIDALEAKVDAEVSALENTDTALQAELDKTQVGAGLNADGSYIFNQESKYLHDATSLNDADLKLDAAVSNIDTRVAALENGGGDIEAEIQALEAKVDAEVSALENADTALQAELDKTQVGAGLDENGNYVKNDEAYFINRATSLNDADVILDAKLSKVEENANAGINALQAEIDELKKESPIAEVDAIEVGAGLNTDGSYIKNEDANYINKATSLADADNKLDAAVKTNADAITAIASETSDAIKEISDKVEALEAKVDTEVNALKNTDTALQAELDKTQVGAGLNADGSYVRNDDATYIDKATSLADADNKLDAAVKANADAITAITSETSDAIKEISDKVEALEAKVDTEVSALESTDTALQAELDKTQVGAGLSEDGSYTRNDDATYIDKANSLADADNKLDAAIKTNADAITELAQTVSTTEGALEDKIAEVDEKVSEVSSTTENVQSELDKTQVGAGLDEDGKYIKSGKPYISQATSLASADDILADAVKANEDAIKDVKESVKESLGIDNTEHNVKLTRSEDNKLSAEAVINTDHTDNILVNDHHSLYVPSTPIYNAIDEAKTEVTALVNEEKQARITSVASISGSVDALSTTLHADMSTLSSDVDSKLNVIKTTTESLVQSEAAARELADVNNYNDLLAKITEASGAVSVAVDTTDTVAMSLENKTIKSNVIVSTETGNIITKNNGLYASVTFDYDAASNTITFSTSNGQTQTHKLASVSAVDKIYYDGVTDELVFEFTTSTAEEKVETRIPAASFFKGIVGSGKDEEHNITVATALTQGDNSATAVTANLDIDDIISTKPSTITLKNDGTNKITASINIASNVPHNILKTDTDEEGGNSVYALGTSKNIYLESPIIDTNGEAICNDEGNEGCISNVDAAIQYLVNGFNELYKYINLVTIDTPTVTLTVHEDKSLQADVNISKNNLNLIEVNEDGIYVEGSIDYSTFGAANTRYLQLKRNNNTFDSKETALAYLNSEAFLEDKKDGEPVIVTYKNGDEINLLQGIIRVTATEEGDVKNIYTFDNQGTTIDKVEYVADATEITTNDAFGTSTVTNVPAESIYVEYTDASNKKHSIVVDMTKLIEEFSFPQAQATFDGQVAVADGVDDTKASDAAWGAEYPETSARTHNNVQFDVERNKDGKTTIKADVDYFDCGWY